MKVTKLLIIICMILLATSGVFATFGDPNRHEQNGLGVPDTAVRNIHDAEQGYGDSVYISNIEFNATSNEIEYGNLVSLTSTQDSSLTYNFLPRAPIACDYDLDLKNELITFANNQITIYGSDDNNTISAELVLTASDEIININCADFTGAIGDFIRSATMGDPQVVAFNSMITGLDDEHNVLVVLTETGIETLNTGRTALVERVDLSTLGTPVTDLYCTNVLEQGDYACTVGTDSHLIFFYSQQDEEVEIVYQIKTIEESLLNGGYGFEQLYTTPKLGFVGFDLTFTSGEPKGWFMYSPDRDDAGAVPNYYHTYLNESYGSSLTATSQIAKGTMPYTLDSTQTFYDDEFSEALAYSFSDNGKRQICFGTSSPANALSQARYRCIEGGTTVAFASYSSTTAGVYYNYGFFDFAQVGIGGGMTFYKSATSAYEVYPVATTVTIGVYPGMGAKQFVRAFNLQNENGYQMTYFGDGLKGAVFSNSAYPTVTNATNVSFADNTLSYTALYATDLNDDFENEIIGYDGVTGTIDIYSGKPFIAPQGVDPVYITNGKANGGYFGFYEGDVCVNTTLYINAKQCISGDNNCNYFAIGDVLNRERLYTDWDGAHAPTNGSYSALAPSLSAVLATPGDYEITVYLEPETTPGARYAYNTDPINITVIDGIEGVTCNRGDAFIASPDENPGGILDPDAPPDVEPPTDEDDLFSTVAGLNPILRFFIMIGIVLGLAIWANNNTNGNPLITTIGAILGLGASVLLGLISITVVLIAVIVFVIMLFAMHKLGTSGNNLGSK